MGIVLKAHDPELDRAVILKVLRPDRIDDDGRERFVREGRAAAALEHDHVVPVYAVLNPTDAPPYLVMPYVPGPTLRERIQAEGRLNPAEAARICRQVAEGVEAAHRAGLVHRDIKPSNIILDVAHDRARVVDFGLVRLKESAGGLTQQGTLLGTPEYMSPEQIRQPETTDERSDVYSLGVTLYEALTGQVPFYGALHSILDRILHEEPVPPRRHNERIPRDLETICLKALAKEPGRRYSGAQALADDLRRWLGGMPIQARPIPLRERLWLWCRQNPALAATSALAVAAAVAVAGASLYVAVLARQHARDLGAALDTSETNRRQATARLAEQYLDRGLTLCEQQDAGRGLLWLARSLEIAPDDAKDLRRATRINLAGWQSHSHRLKAILPQHGKVIRALFSPDGRAVVTAGPDRNVRFWDAATAAPHAAPLAHPDRVTVVAFSRDAPRLLTGADDGIARLWNTTSRTVIRQWKAQIQGFHNVALSPDGRLALTCGNDTAARLFDTDTGSLLHRLEHEKLVRAVAFSPDGRLALTGGADRTARLWDAVTGRLLRTLPHIDTVRSLEFSPDGRTVVTGSMDTRARLWDTATGRPLGEPFGMQGAVPAVTFSPDSRLVLLGNMNTPRLWDARTRRPLGMPLLHHVHVTAVAFSPDGKTFLTASHDAVRLWEIAPALQPPRQILHEATIQSVAASPDGRFVLTGDRDGTVKLSNIATGTCRAFSHPHEVNAVAFSPDGRTFLVAGGRRDGTRGEARLRRVADGQPIGPPLRHDQAIPSYSTVAFSSDSRTAITGSLDGAVRLWDVTTGENKLDFRHAGPVQALALSADGTTIVTAGAPSGQVGEVRLWEARTGKPLRGPLPHSASVSAVAFSPDGHSLATGAFDGSTRVWNVRTGELRLTFHHQAQVRAVAYSPDGHKILTGSFDHTARLWDAATGQPLTPPLEHQDWIRTVAFSPDGKYLVSASFDHTARLWDAATGKPLGPPLVHQSWVLSLAFHPEGRTVVTCSMDRTARIWPVPQALPGDVERIHLWLNVNTGTRLGNDGVLRVLEPLDWRASRERLQELGERLSRDQ
jgi:WD40 repeat protein